VVVEDLQSANGVFVNSAKLLRPLMVLDEGDRILVGTTELSVFSTRVANTATSTYPVASVPVNSVVQLKRTNLAEPANCEATRSTEKYPFAVTKRSAGPQSIGLFAEQIMSVGHPLEAIRVLSEHLESVLAGATAGLIVPAEILLSATQNAFRMYRWTKRASWLEYVLELHLASQQVPSEEVLPEFEAGVVASADFDSALIRYFCATLERRVNPLTVDEMKRLRLIERFGKSEKSDSYSPPSR
jgi:predicted component of type VI protein secretion system